MNSITITTDRLPHPKVRGNARGKVSWVRRERMREEKAFMERLYYSDDWGQGSANWTKARISYDYYNNREIDTDNFHIGCKAWQDALVNVGLLKDDKPSTLKLGHIEWHKCKRGEEKVVILIEELE